VFVSGVYQYRFAALLAAKNVYVVVQRSDDDTMQFHPGVFVVHEHQTMG
jgi:hypothetical protein